MDLSVFFIRKFQSVTKSFYSLNSFGFKPGGVSPFLQARIYKTFCISRFLYGFEIFDINKKTLNKLNVAQNNIIRYMTGLSSHSHISQTAAILQMFNIFQLFVFMKLFLSKI
jgi:hypothetical protein